MLGRQLFSVTVKQLGRTRGIGHLPSRSTRSIAALSWPSSSPVCTVDSDHRQFSSMPLRRPPQKGKERGQGIDEQRNTKQKWRSHAVSLGFGNYQDDFEFDGVDGYGGDANMSVSDSARTTTTSSSSSWDEDESELAEQVQEIQRENDKRRKRWLKNAKPPVRTSIIDERGRAYGRGGRKTASARVWIQPGFGNVVINRKDFVDYFDRTSDRELILEPLAATETLGRFDITATVEGGGLRGQAGAIRHGLARALNHYNPDVYRPPLKRLGYLTRDPRKVERKKIGHLKARKKPQWVKR